MYFLLFQCGSKINRREIMHETIWLKVQQEYNFEEIHLKNDLLYLLLSILDKEKIQIFCKLPY